MRFCGRVAELDELIARWKLASDIAAPSPQLVILKAERGVGKTRLALEFYRWLSENIDAKGPDGYWPDSASIFDRSIDVNPDPYACRYDQSMPFLWWGLRAADPGTENRISGDAVASYDKFLAPHLVALTMKARAIKSGKALLGVWRDVAKGEAASWSGYDTVMSVGEGLFKTVQILRGTMEQSHSSALEEITKKSISRVDAVLEDLEIVLNTRSPGFAKTPAIILIDDAQFSTEDPGLVDFCEKLLHMAMTQKWPLMILVTHWKRDLSPEFMTTERSFAGVIHHARTRATHENGPVAGLPGGHLTTQNTIEIDLAPVPDLTEALHHALPGLLPDQASALLDHAGGNPRHLEQIIAFLRENEEFFEDFDTANALTEEGLREALEETHDILKVVMRRLRDAPVEVQEAICLASLQGMRFVSEIVNDLAKVCLSGERSDALKKASDPFSMVSLRQKASIAEFSERLFYLVAEKRRRSLKGLSDTAALTVALQDILRERSTQIDVDTVDDVDAAVMTLGLTAQVFSETEPVVALNALCAVAKLEEARFSYSAALSAAESFARMIEPDFASWSKISFFGAQSVAEMLASDGKHEKALEIRQALLETKQAEAAQSGTPRSLRIYSIALERFSDSVLEKGDVATSIKLRNNVLQLRRKLWELTGTVQARRDHMIALNRVGSAAVAAGDLKSAFDPRHESLAISRELLALTEAYEGLSDLARSLEFVGQLAMDTLDFKSAKQAFGECLDLRRELVSRYPNTDTKRALTVALWKLGDVLFAEHDASGAKRIWQDALELAREQVTIHNSTSSQSNLAYSLIRVSDAFKALLNNEAAKQAAKQAAEECLEIRKVLADRTGSLRSQVDLATAFEAIGDIDFAAGDLVAAKQSWSQSLKIREDLLSKSKTPISLRNYAISLDRMGDASMMAHEVIEAVRYWRDCHDVRRDLFASVPTPKHERDTWLVLNKLADASFAAGDLPSATIAWHEGLRIARSVALQVETIDSRFDLSISLFKAGLAAAYAEDEMAVAQSFSESVEILRRLYQESESPRIRLAYCQTVVWLAASKDEHVERSKLLLEADKLLEGLSEAERESIASLISEICSDD